eukprot:gnl/TRDRNA2_/TRDRNA2_149297_c0_seq1.p1 gnl/TRDRNA2_/TRDRNA2_149297_c0~~gnl/TRDRNA2_/TRDRNA2_149297_c0_seq1.p1  ORF type:complete len:593 (+),score=75.28 gnl/TRDRNA2_/TRDRNA2_149297_c0_seq1:167-1780(+)
MVDFQVYVLSIYGAPELLQGEEGSAADLQAVLRRSSDEKLFVLTFLRTVSGQQCRSGLTEQLVDNAGVPKAEVDQALAVLPDSISQSSEICFSVSPCEGKITIAGSLREDAGRVVTLQSPEFVRGIHEVYLGTNSVIKGLTSSIKRQHSQRSSWVVCRERQGLDAGMRCNSWTESDMSAAEDAPLTPRSPEVDEAPEAPKMVRQVSPGGLATIASGCELSTLGEAKCSSPRTDSKCSSPCADGGSPSGGPPPRSPRSSSWRESSGRVSGKEEYVFGDLTRSLVTKARKRLSSGGMESSEPWPGALTFEGEVEAAWVSPDWIPKLNADVLAKQNLEAVLYKHHSSPVRGRFAPKWTLRLYKLESGTLRYQRREGGKLSDPVSLDGARVVVELPKTSRMGDFFVFRVVRGRDEVCRLSSPDRGVAVEWVLSLAAACSYFRAQHFPDVDAHTEQIGQQDRQRVEAEANGEKALVPSATATMASESNQAMPPQSIPDASRSVLQSSSKRRAVWPRRLLLSILAAFFVLISSRRLRRRAIAT